MLLKLMKILPSIKTISKTIEGQIMNRTALLAVIVALGTVMATLFPAYFASFCGTI